MANFIEYAEKYANTFFENKDEKWLICFGSFVKGFALGSTANSACDALSTLLAEGIIECKDIELAQERLKQILSNT